MTPVAVLFGKLGIHRSPEKAWPSDVFASTKATIGPGAIASGALGLLLHQIWEIAERETEASASIGLILLVDVISIISTM